MIDIVGLARLAAGIMMIGPLVDSAVTFLGGVGGGLIGSRIGERTRRNLTLVFGLASMAMGITLIVKMQRLPAVIISLIAGVLIGEVAALEDRVNFLATKLRAVLGRMLPQKSETLDLSQEDFLRQFVAVLVLFCASGTGIFGAMNEGITGDPSLLLAKSVLDLFTAGIFAATLGLPVAAVAIPQLLIQATLYYLGGVIMPLTTPAMLGDFSSCGGIIMLATGLRIADIKSFPLVNLLPALVLVMPVSMLWMRYVG